MKSRSWRSNGSSGAEDAAPRPNFSAGLFYYSKTVFIGASLPFVLTHRYQLDGGAYSFSQERLDAEPMLTGGYVMKVSSDLKLKPSALLRYRLDSGVQADISGNVIFKDMIWVGVSYRTLDAVIGMIEVLPTPQWRLGYSYDLGLSAIRQYHHGSHELMIQDEFGDRIRVRDPRYF